MKGWFNDKILRLAEQSNVVAEAYLKEHQESIKNDALGISKEINQKFNTVFLDLNKLNSFLNVETDIRELTEAFIFKKGGILLAKAGFTISSTPDVITDIELIEVEGGKLF